MVDLGRFFGDGGAVVVDLRVVLFYLLGLVGLFYFLVERRHSLSSPDFLGGLVFLKFLSLA